MYAATHSVDVTERIAGLERAYPVTVGNDVSPSRRASPRSACLSTDPRIHAQVWIGGGVMLIGPCVIGDNCTVAAGTVVRGTWPANVVIGGNPARVLKQLEPPPPEKQ